MTPKAGIVLALALAASACETPPECVRFEQRRVWDNSLGLALWAGDPTRLPYIGMGEWKDQAVCVEWREASRGPR